MKTILYRALAVAVAFSPYSFLSGQSPAPGAAMPNILYGAAYYNEYMPAEICSPAVWIGMSPSCTRPG